MTDLAISGQGGQDTWQALILGCAPEDEHGSRRHE